MQIKVKPMGQYQTNCYIVNQNGNEIIIDPGVGAVEWVMKNVRSPAAEKDPFGQGVPKSRADVAVEPDARYTIGGIDVTFLHFPGHTPGCSAIEIGDNWFCGDFLFRGSIGRVDFPYSDPEAMKRSLKRAMEYPKDVTLYPGHGPKTTLKAEKRNIPYWIEMI